MRSRYQSRYQSRRAARKLVRRSKWNFFITLIVISVLIYSTITWILPALIGGLGTIKNITSPPKKVVIKSSENANLAPPVLNIPYEATGTAQINITGYATPDTEVRLYVDDEDRQTAGVSSEGNFTFEDISLSLGINNIYGVSLDADGKESLPSKTIKIIYDDEKPSLSVSEPEDNRKIQGGDKKVKVSGTTEPGAKIFINGAQTVVSSEGSFSTDQPLNDGDNDISIKAVDAALNAAEISRRVNYTAQETQ